MRVLIWIVVGFPKQQFLESWFVCWKESISFTEYNLNIINYFLNLPADIFGSEIMVNIAINIMHFLGIANKPILAFVQGLLVLDIYIIYFFWYYCLTFHTDKFLLLLCESIFKHLSLFTALEKYIHRFYFYFLFQQNWINYLYFLTSIMAQHIISFFRGFLYTYYNIIIFCLVLWLWIDFSLSRILTVQNIKKCEKIQFN